MCSECQRDCKKFLETVECKVCAEECKKVSAQSATRGPSIQIGGPSTMVALPAPLRVVDFVRLI
jgi:hypothetical protein